MPRSASLAAAPKSGFYGYITLDGKALPAYTPLSIWIGDNKIGESVCYAYQGQSFFLLEIPADDPVREGLDGGREGDVIAFKVGDAIAEQKVVWHAGRNMRISLSATTPPRPIRVRFEGVISGITPVGGSGDVLWTVAGADVLVGAATVVEPAGYQPVVGDWALVHAIQEGDNIPRAERIVVRVSAIEAAPYEFRGIIEAIESAGQSLIVAGTRVVTDGETQVTGELVVGYVAQVAGERKIDGSVLARQISAYAPEDVAKQVEFEGTIEEMQPEWWTVSGVRVWIANADIPRQGHIGLTAEVSGVERPDGSIEAAYILVEEINPSDEQRFSGRVVSIAPASWVLELEAGALKTVYLDASSFIDESRAPAMVGNLATVLAMQRQDGSLLALRIRLERPN